MTDFHNSGGMLALLHELRPLLHLNAMTITGRTLGEEIASTTFHPVPRDSRINCIRPFYRPLYPASSLAVLRGNLAPGGAVIKASASKDRRLLNHTGPAVVFSDTGDLARRIDDRDLAVTLDSVLVLKSIGPIGHPGMPEAGLIPIPRKLGAVGVQDMLRLSDGRMSGTAGGTIVLHISPESALVDSVFGIIEDGDIVRLEAERRLLEIELTEDIIEWRIRKRQENLEKEKGNVVGQRMIQKKRGYRGLY